MSAMVATGLSFNVSAAGVVDLIQARHTAFPPAISISVSKLPLVDCAAGETIVPDYFAVDGVEVTGLSGSLQLNPPPVAGVPEPAALSLVGLGIAGVGSMKRRKAMQALNFIVSAQESVSEFFTPRTR